MLDAKAGLFILVIGGLGMSAPVQGGIRAFFHFIVSRTDALYGISETEGIVYATIVSGYQTILVIALGAIGFFVLMATGKKLKPTMDYNEIINKKILNEQALMQQLSV